MSGVLVRVMSDDVLLFSPCDLFLFCFGVLFISFLFVLFFFGWFVFLGGWWWMVGVVGVMVVRS